MEITGLDFFLINCLSYLSGVATGLILCCKYKDRIFIRSQSRDNLSAIDNLSTIEANQNTNQLPYTSPVIATVPTASAPSVTKITLE